MRKLRRIARVTIALPIVAIALSACAPSGGSAPPTIDCTGVGNTATSPAVEQCHGRYRAYKYDNSSGFAQSRANAIAGALTSCSQIGNYHVTGQQLLQNYPGSTAVAENLFCYWSSAGCASAHFGATKAINAWLNSSGHKRNMDNFAGSWVNAAGACVGGRNYWIGVAQFHKP